MTSVQSADPRAGRALLCAVALLALARLLSLPYYPLMDTTEARYADIARRMLDQSDWVTPWIGDGVPFWGKPPLSFWATKVGFTLFGVGEWGARLPHYLLGAAASALVWWQGRAESHRAAWHAVALLTGSLLFLTASGAVMTDMALTLGTTAVMVGFWRAMNSDSQDQRTRRHAGWLMVLGAIIGLLAKGPVSLVLCGVPIGGWVLFSGQIRRAWECGAWLRNTGLVLGFTLPWYVLAEIHTPGFLHYFIVGEHWQRFVTPGWTGDLYGSGHRFPHGSIWLFAVASTLPWSILLPAAAWAGLQGRQGKLPGTAPRHSGEVAYLLAWGLTPCLFFTFAGNILWTYVLPGLPALALLAGSWTASRQRNRLAEGLLTAGLSLCIVAVVGVLAAGHLTGRFETMSARGLVQAFQHRAVDGAPLYFIGKPPFSASFYLAGQARAVDQLDDLPSGHAAWVVLSRSTLAGLPAPQQERLRLVLEQGTSLLMRLQ